MTERPSPQASASPLIQEQELDSVLSSIAEAYEPRMREITGAGFSRGCRLRNDKSHPIDYLSFSDIHTWDSTDPVQRNPFNPGPAEMHKKREVALSIAGRRRSHEERVRVELPRGFLRRLFGMKARIRLENRQIEEDVFVGVDVKVITTLIFEIRREKEVGIWNTGGSTQIAEKERKVEKDRETNVAMDVLVASDRMGELRSAVESALSRLDEQLRWVWQGGPSHQE